MAKHRDQPHSTRTRARKRAMQALYQWQLAGGEADDISAQFESEQDFRKVDVGYFRSLVSGAIEQAQALDAALTPHLDRPFVQVDPLERAILLLSAYEILFAGDVPPNVSINEAITLARQFGATGSHAFVNGVLDKLAHSNPGNAGAETGE